MSRVAWRCVLVASVAAGCAHVEPPPGGPEDRTPPRLAASQPESLSVVPNWTAPVLLVFDERISERQVEEAVQVSPRTSPVQVERGRSSIRVSLRGGWRPGTVYHVTVRRDVQDLFGNRLAEPVTVVFSTGPPIPSAGVVGSVVDRVTGRPEADLRVEAVRRADSLVYAVATDSAGGFRIAHVPEGGYLLRAYRDMNRNRALDPYEPRDSAVREVGLADPGALRLSIVAPDSTPARLASAVAVAAGRVELRFDDYLDPSQELTPASVEIVSAAGESVPVARVGRPEAGGGPGVADTTGAVAPSQTLVVELATGAALVPGTTYRVAIRGVRNLVGLVSDAGIELQVPPAAGGGGAAGGPD